MSRPVQPTTSFAKFLSDLIRESGDAKLASFQDEDMMQVTCQRCKLIRRTSLSMLLSGARGDETTLNDLGITLVCERPICASPTDIRPI
jgi:hypothetical protein